MDNKINLTVQDVVEPILSFDDLMTSHEVLIRKENADQQLLLDFINPNASVLKPRLYEWAAKGFQVPFILQTITIEIPIVCSDGVTRDFPAYFTHIVSMKLEDLRSKFKALFPGFTVLYSYNHNSLTIFLEKPS